MRRKAEQTLSMMLSDVAARKLDVCLRITLLQWDRDAECVVRFV